MCDLHVLEAISFEGAVRMRGGGAHHKAGAQREQRPHHGSRRRKALLVDRVCKSTWKEAQDEDGMQRQLMRQAVVKDRGTVRAVKQ
jgi:hypothetical protein